MVRIKEKVSILVKSLIERKDANYQQTQKGNFIPISEHTVNQKLKCLHNLNTYSDNRMKNENN